MPIEISDESLFKLYGGGKRKGGKSFDELADIFGLSRNAVAGKIFRYKQSHLKKGVKANPDLFKVRLHAPIDLVGDWMIVGDIHVPTTDYDFAQLPAAIGKKYRIKNLVVAGDLYNMDHFSLYPKRIDHATWKQEKLAAMQLMAEWIRVFDRIVLLMGNHERRLERLAEGAYDDEDIFSHLLGSGKVETTDYGWCTIETRTGIWRITHPRNYSVLQLRVASELAQKFQQHIISHHEHHLGKGWDRYKNYVIVNNGGLFDPKKMSYVVLDDSKSAGMAKGFTMLKDGTPYVFGEEPFTDWGWWL